MAVLASDWGITVSCRKAIPRSAMRPRLMTERKIKIPIIPVSILDLGGSVCSVDGCSVVGSPATVGRTQVRHRRHIKGARCA